MRPNRRHALVSLALGLAGAASFSGCVLPLSSGDQNCVSYCTLLQGCGSPAAPAGDCNAWCSGFAPIVERTGCKPLFDDSTSCVVADGTCQAASCTDVTQSYLDCTEEFCAANPTDAACPSQ